MQSAVLLLHLRLFHVVSTTALLAVFKEIYAAKAVKTVGGASVE